MSLPVGQLAEVQDSLSGLLKQSPFFARIPIFTEKLKDIENEIDTALGSLAGGACVVVITPKATVTKPNLPGPYFDDVVIVVRILENVLINQSPEGTQVPASALAEGVAHALHLQHTGGGKIIICAGLSIVPDEANLIYDVTFKTKFGL